MLYSILQTSEPTVLGDVNRQTIGFNAIFPIQLLWYYSIHTSKSIAISIVHGVWTMKHGLLFFRLLRAYLLIIYKGRFTVPSEVKFLTFAIWVWHLQFFTHELFVWDFHFTQNCKGPFKLCLHLQWTWTWKYIFSLINYQYIVL